MRRLVPVLSALYLCGCVATQSIPVSTDPSGAAVHLDGKLACPATPCSVDAEKDKAHLLTITKDGYRQKDIALRPQPGPNGGQTLAPDMVTLRLSKPGELDPRDPDSVVDTAVGLGINVLGRVLEGDRQDSGKGERGAEPGKQRKQDPWGVLDN